MNRRGFLGSILALGAAPAIVRADSLMRIVPMETLVALDAEAMAEVVGAMKELWLEIPNPAYREMLYGVRLNPKWLCRIEASA